VIVSVVLYESKTESCTGSCFLCFFRLVFQQKHLNMPRVINNALVVYRVKIIK